MENKYLNSLTNKLKLAFSSAVWPFFNVFEKLFHEIFFNFKANQRWEVDTRGEKKKTQSQPQV